MNNYLNSTFIQNSFSKGIIEDEFRYNNSEFIFEKSGKDIKVKIDFALKSILSKAEIEIKEAFKIIKDIQIKPDVLFKTYGMNKLKIEELNLKKYSYSILNQQESLIRNSGLNQYPKVDYTYSDIRKLSPYHKYNLCIEKYVDLLKDKFILETFKNNLENNKMYKLNLKQLTILGF